MLATRLSLLGLLLLAVSVGSCQGTSNSSTLPTASAANATVVSNWTESHADSSIHALVLLNASNSNISTNASSAALSSPAYAAAIAGFVRSVLDHLSTFGPSGVELANSTNSTSSQLQYRLTTDLLIQLLDSEGAAMQSGSTNRSHFSAPLNATINATAHAIAAALSNSTNTTILSQHDSSDDVTFESLELQDQSAAQHSPSTSDNSSSRQSDDQIRLEHVVTGNSQTLVISHALAGAVEAALAAEAEAARESAAQFHATSETPAAVETTAVAAATESAPAGSASDALRAWIPIAAAVGATVVLVGAALFGVRNHRRQRGYNALSPGSLRLAQLTPPRELA